MTAIAIHLAGAPVAKQSARFFRNPGGFIQARQPAKVKKCEARVKAAAERAMEGRQPFDSAVTLRLCLNMQVPKSWSKKKRAEAFRHLILPTTRPDLDNLCKAVLDGLKGVVYRDDSQITDLTVTKRYAPEPGVDILAREITAIDLIENAQAGEAA